MTFKTFVITQLDPSGSDPMAAPVMEIIKESTFPDTENISQMAKHIYLKLDHQQTTKYQQLLMLWLTLSGADVANNNAMYLKQINEVVEMQNSDSAYPFKS